jgi:hypothetical protein
VTTRVRRLEAALTASLKLVQAAEPESQTTPIALVTLDLNLNL